MEKILKSIGWGELLPDTIKRLSFFSNGFRDAFYQDEISNADIENSVAYAFGRYGQGMVYDIYCKLERELVNGRTMGAIVKDFIKAFKETLSETTITCIKPHHYIDLFIELLYSFVIKNT